MKKLIVILVLVLSFISCKKESCKTCQTIVIQGIETYYYNTTECGDVLSNDDKKVVMGFNTSGDLIYFRMTICK